MCHYAFTGCKYDGYEGNSVGAASCFRRGLLFNPKGTLYALCSKCSLQITDDFVGQGSLRFIAFSHTSFIKSFLGNLWSQGVKMNNSAWWSAAVVPKICKRNKWPPLPMIGQFRFLWRVAGAIHHHSAAFWLSHTTITIRINTLHLVIIAGVRVDEYKNTPLSWCGRVMSIEQCWKVWTN